MHRRKAQEAANEFKRTSDERSLPFSTLAPFSGAFVTGSIYKARTRAPTKRIANMGVKVIDSVAVLSASWSV